VTEVNNMLILQVFIEVLTILFSVYALSLFRPSGTALKRTL
jgi:hypothetical protein